jgi:hypothetical protein
MAKHPSLPKKGRRPGDQPLSGAGRTIKSAASGVNDAENDGGRRVASSTPENQHRTLVFFALVGDLEALVEEHVVLTVLVLDGHQLCSPPPWP